MTRRLLTILFFITLVSVSSHRRAEAASFDGYKIESIAALTETSVSETMRSKLADKGMRILAKDGKAVCEFWLSKEINAKATGVDGATFGQIAEGTLIGIIHFPNKTNDYRGQTVKAGFYVLRYILGPMDGAHLGVAPSRDFFLLSAPADDNDPKDLPPGEVLKLSRKASGSGHPSPWALTVPTKADQDLPAVTINDHEHVVLEIKLPAKANSLSVGLVVIGKTAE